MSELPQSAFPVARFNRLTKYQEDRPWIVTRAEPEGQYSLRVHYLLSDGRRRAVIFTYAELDEQKVQAAGDALEAKRTGIGRGESG